MSKERPIHYEPHPVTPERKAELLAEGYKIIDAVFQPVEAEDVKPDEDKPKRGRKAAAITE